MLLMTKCEPGVLKPLRGYDVRLRAVFSGVILILASGLWAPMAIAAPGFTPHSAEYKVKMSVLSGRLRTQLKSTPTGYQATHRVEPTGLAKMFAKGAIEERSSFNVTGNGVLPIHYLSSDTLSKKKTHAEVDFDWSDRSLAGVVNDVAIAQELETFVRDRVSIQYQLMHDLLRGDGRGNEQYVLFDIDEMKTVNIRSIGSKRVKVPAGKFEAIGIQHQRKNSSRVTTLWCVEELGFLPVIIEQHRKGKRRLYATLKTYEPISTGASGGK